MDSPFSTAPIAPYRAALPPEDLLARLRELYELRHRADRLICRYFADWADRVSDQASPLAGGHFDLYDEAHRLFGLSVKSTRERVRVGRALRHLLHIDHAFMEGHLSYSRVRELTRAATSSDEQVWLELGLRLDMRTLERCVAQSPAGAGPAGAGPAGAGPAGAGPATQRCQSRSKKRHRQDEPLQCEWATPKTIRVSLTLSAQTWALLERAVQKARRDDPSLLSDYEAFEVALRDALTQKAQWAEVSAGSRSEVSQGGDGDARSEVSQGGEPGRGQVIFAVPATIGPVEAARVLAAMEGRGGWTAEDLGEASGLGVTEVNVALFELEMAHRIRRRRFRYDPVLS